MLSRCACIMDHGSLEIGHAVDMAWDKFKMLLTVTAATVEMVETGNVLRAILSVMGTSRVPFCM